MNTKVLGKTSENSFICKNQNLKKQQLRTCAAVANDNLVNLGDGNFLDHTLLLRLRDVLNHSQLTCVSTSIRLDMCYLSDWRKGLKGLSRKINYNAHGHHAPGCRSLFPSLLCCNSGEDRLSSLFKALVTGSTSAKYFKHNLIRKTYVTVTNVNIECLNISPNVMQNSEDVRSFPLRETTFENFVSCEGSPTVPLSVLVESELHC